MSQFIFENAGALGPIMALLVGMPVTASIFLWRRNIALEAKIDALIERVMQVIEDNTNSANTLRDTLEELKRRQ
jgi:hypothetical protein